MIERNQVGVVISSCESVDGGDDDTFRGYQQQDAHEFMRYLLDRLHSELLTLLPYPNSTSPYICPKGKSTIVTAIFGGILQSEVNCLVCGMESRKHDPFLGAFI